MKKLYLLLLSFISTASIAQTIVQSDLPFAGLGWTSGVDSNYSAAITPGGTGQSWDYSGLQTDYVDTSGFGNAAGTPFAGSFPSANLAALDQSTGDWTYFTNSSTGFYVNGFVTGSVPFVISPAQLYVPVPFSYGNTQTNISRVQLDTTFGIYPARIIINFHADFTADGSGSLITPTTTYPSTLRVKETLLETDSLMIDYTMTGNYILFSAQQHQTTNYRWYTHGNTANYILGIDADSLGATATRSDFIMQWAMLGTNDLTKSYQLKVYPDPATDYVTISTGTTSIESMEVYNIVGEKIQLAAGNISFGKPDLKFDVSDWKAGIYFYSVHTHSSTIEGKFSVHH
jgi:hypothetical protein